jgi:hypothetical protein
MKKIVPILVAISILTALAVRANPTSYIIKSTSSHDLGLVTVSGSSCSAVTNIPFSGSYSVSVGCTITTITIEGHSVVSPETGPVLLSTGTKVSVTWTSPSLVEIWDNNISESPVRR